VQFTPSLVENPLLGVAFALTAAIFVVNLVALGYWAREEAAARDGSVFWTFVALFTVYGVIYYVWVRYVRGDWESRTEPADRRERLVTAYTLALVLAFVVGALVTPPDPVTQVLSLPPLFAGAFVVAYLFVTRRSVDRGGESAA
jgi:sec-independent protein translocase protein TatC